MRTVTPQANLRRISGFVFFLLLAVLCTAWTSNDTAKVIEVSQAVNAMSAPVNPYAGLAAVIIQALGPLAYVLTGMFAHNHGVNKGAAK